MSYDTIIVGARAAGAATAMLLARQGLDVLVLERGRYGTDTLSTNALMRAGVLQLHRWDLLEGLVDAGTPPIRRAVFHYGQETVEVPIRPTDGIDALFAPRRSVLDRILVDAARRAGAEIRFSTTVDGLQWDASGRVLGIIGRDDQGRSISHRANITIGADGIHSRVASAVEAELTQAGTATGGVVFGYFRNPGIDGYHWAYQPGAAAGLIPTNDGALCVFVSTNAQRFAHELQPDIRAGFYRLLHEVVPQFADRLAPDRLVERLRGYPGVAGYYRRPWGRGWALVGDAGYFKDPITAHGISDALRDAELLARAVGEVAADPAVEAAALTRYEQTRDAVSHQFFEITEKIAAYDWTLDQVKGHLYRLSKAMGPEVELILGFDGIGSGRIGPGADVAALEAVGE